MVFALLSPDFPWDNVAKEKKKPHVQVNVTGKQNSVLGLDPPQRALTGNVTGIRTQTWLMHKGKRSKQAGKVSEGRVPASWHRRRTWDSLWLLYLGAEGGRRQLGRSSGISMKGTVTVASLRKGTEGRGLSLPRGPSVGCRERANDPCPPRSWLEASGWNSTGQAS